MLYRQKHASGRTLYRSRPLLFSPAKVYVRPTESGRAWFQTTTTVWRADELIRRRVRDWRRLLGETGHTGARTQTMRKDHDSVYTGTHSSFPCPLVEWILLRYAPKQPGARVVDSFAGGAARGVVCTIMGYEYIGFEIRQEQIDENVAVLTELNLNGWHYHLADGRFLNADIGLCDFALTCPPYWNLEKYSDDPMDLSNANSYGAFNADMWFSAHSLYENLSPGAFCCIVVGPFRNKTTGELIDFPAHTVSNFQDAGFTYWQQVVIAKNYASAAKRSTTSWKGQKLVPAHEFLLVFRKPE